MHDSIARTISHVAPRLEDDVDTITHRFAEVLVTHAVRRLERVLEEQPDRAPYQRLLEQARDWLAACVDGDDEALCLAAVATRDSFARMLVGATLRGREDRALCAALGQLTAAVDLADRACMMASLVRES